MTDSLVLFQSSPAHYLRSALKHFVQLQNAANQCHVMLRWFGSHRAQHLPVLDFDVVWGALPSAARMPSFDKREGETGLWSPSQLTGPHTVRAILENASKLCLPIGTFAELTDCVTLTRREVSSTAASFVERIGRLADYGAIPSMVTDPAGLRLEKLLDSLVLDLADASAHFDDLSLLEGLKERNIPYEELVRTDERSTAKSTEAFKASLTFLTETRGARKRQNNLYDALNVACTVQIFNSPKTRDAGRPLPLFITETERLGRFTVSPWLNLDYDRMPELTHDGLFLMLFQGLMAESDDNIQIASDSAGVLVRRVNELFDLLQRIVEFELVHDTLSSSGFSLLELAHRKHDEIMRRWRGVLCPAARAREFDRTHAINTVLRQRIKSIIRNTMDPNSSRRGVEIFLESIRQFESDHHQFWKALVAAGRSSPQDVRPSSVFRTEWQLNDGSLLSDRAIPVSPPAAAKKFGAQWRKQVCLAAYVDFYQVAIIRLCLDDGGRPALVWAHNRDIEQLLYLLFEFCGLEQDKALPITLYSSEGCVHALVRAGRLEEVHAQALLKTDFVSAQGPDCVLFADIEPIDGADMQIGIVSSTTTLPAQRLDALIERTSSVPVDTAMVRPVLARMVAEFWGSGTERMTGDNRNLQRSQR